MCRLDYAHWIRLRLCEAISVASTEFGWFQINCNKLMAHMHPYILHWTYQLSCKNYMSTKIYLVTLFILTVQIGFEPQLVLWLVLKLHNIYLLEYICVFLWICHSSHSTCLYILCSPVHGCIECPLLSQLSCQFGLVNDFSCFCNLKSPPKNNDDRHRLYPAICCIRFCGIVFAIILKNNSHCWHLNMSFCGRGQNTTM